MCEGRDETELVKAIVRKLGIEFKGCLGITDAGGIENLYELAKIMVNLIKSFRKVKALGLITDSEEMSPEERVKSSADSLGSVGVEIRGVEERCFQTYEITRTDEDIKLYAAVSGLHGVHRDLDFSRFRKHSINDHVALLISLEDRGAKEELDQVTEIEQFTSRFRPYSS